MAVVGKSTGVKLLFNVTFNDISVIRVARTLKKIQPKAIYSLLEGVMRIYKNQIFKDLIEKQQNHQGSKIRNS